MNFSRHQRGISMVELLITAAIAAMLLTGVQQLLSTGMESKAQISTRIDLNRQARFAIEAMGVAVRRGSWLLLPLPDNPATDWDENIRTQTIPASAPQGSSTLATAVLALSMSPLIDLDFDGFADTDNDRDGLIDEDPSGDVNNDLAPGIFGVDDDGDGSVDEQHTQAWLGNMGPVNEDDDEDDFANENGWTGIDEDGDGNINEDPKKDMNSDALPGIGGVDDDDDGTVDEGDKNDDDEDGLVNEDWLDTTVFYLSGDSLIQRHSVPWDENGDTLINGRDFIESVIADKVVLLRFERPVTSGEQLIDITLSLSDQGESVSLTTRLRVGLEIEGLDL